MIIVGTIKMIMATAISVETRPGNLEVGQPFTDTTDVSDSLEVEAPLSFSLDPYRAAVIEHTLIQFPMRDLTDIDLALQLLKRSYPQAAEKITGIQQLTRQVIGSLRSFTCSLEGPLPITNKFSGVNDPHPVIDLDQMQTELPPSLIH